MVELQINQFPIIKWELPIDGSEKNIRASLLLWPKDTQVNILIDGKLEATVDREVIYS